VIAKLEAPDGVDTQADVIAKLEARAGQAPTLA
jgi:hypothetical protein